MVGRQVDRGGTLTYFVLRSGLLARPPTPPPPPRTRTQHLPPPLGCIPAGVLVSRVLASVASRRSPVLPSITPQSDRVAVQLAAVFRSILLPSRLADESRRTTLHRVVTRRAMAASDKRKRGKMPFHPKYRSLDRPIIELLRKSEITPSHWEKVLYKRIGGHC